VPIRPIDQIHRTRRRRAWTAAGLVTALAVAFVLIISAGLLPGDNPAITSPTTVPAPDSTATITPPTTTAASTTTSTTVAAAPLIPATGIDAQVIWFDGFSVGTANAGEDPVLLTDGEGINMGMKMIADDGAGGFVTLRDSATLLWWQAGASEPSLVAVTDDQPIEIIQLLDIVRIDDEVYADVMLAGRVTTIAGECDPRRGLVDLSDGTLPQGIVGAALPSVGRTTGWVVSGCPGEQPLIIVGDLTATLFVPEYTNTDPETGAPLSPIPMSQLVVTDAIGTEVARFDVTTDEQPFAVLHDFDGRRILVSREAWEPALAPRTFFIIDLECIECGLGEPFTTPGAASADLMR
jgi:hypothetical protein